MVRSPFITPIGRAADELECLSQVQSTIPRGERDPRFRVSDLVYRDEIARGAVSVLVSVSNSRPLFIVILPIRILLAPRANVTYMLHESSGVINEHGASGQ